jgi:Tfp pilus assembly protein PilE
MSEYTLINFIIVFLGFILCCVVLVLVIRSILALIIYISYKKYLKLKESAKKILPQSKKNFIKEDEELSRKKDEIPRAHSKTKADILNAKKQQKFEILEENNVNVEEEFIVGVAPAVGFWTRKLFGERIATIMAQADSMKKGESTQFWQNFIKASRAQERVKNSQYQRK